MKKLLLAFAFGIAITNSLDCAMPGIESVKNLKDIQVRFVEFMFCDITGSIRSVMQPIENIERALEYGLYCDGSSLQGAQRITNSDMLLIPSIETARLIPWTKGNTLTANVMCDLYVDHETVYESDPRYVLQKVMQEARQMGFEFMTGAELEMYIFAEKKRHAQELQPFDMQDYFATAATCDNENIKATVLSMLDAMDLAPIEMHHEVGPGQFEIPFKYSNALRMADTIVQAKHALQSLGNSSKMHISFMPKPLKNQNGSGMHIHFSLFDAETQQNVFYDPDNPTRLSAIAQSFIAGILKHARQITLLLNPTVNSFKRLVPGYEAPIYVCCGIANRSALVRLPMYNPEDPQAARAEIRSVDPSCNPYLALAAILKAGLEGIKNNYAQSELIAENLYSMPKRSIKEKNISTIPTSLQEALDEFKQSKLMHQMLGQHLFDEYIKAKKKELRSFYRAITDWELEHYL